MKAVKIFKEFSILFIDAGKLILISKKKDGKRVRLSVVYSK